jgi:salicylate hydroxylase
MPRRTILVVGAGIAGLTSALALQQRGAKVIVAEQAPVLGEVGAGLTLTPNCTRVFHHLGLEKELADILLVPAFQQIRHWKSGDLILEKQRGDRLHTEYGFPYGHVHRADVHKMLADAVAKADPGAIRLGFAAVSAKTYAKSARVTFANGETLKADVVIGADGVRSPVRQALFPATPPRFTGHVAWRGIVPTKKLLKEIAEAPPGLFIGPGRLFMRYPLRGGSVWNFAAFARQPGWTTESWSAKAKRADPLAVFEGWHDVVRQTLEATPPSALFKWALYARDPLTSWVSGRVTLVGDAAHGMLPFLGQGAAMGVEDAMVLARCLTEIDDPDAALARYQLLRKERCDVTQKEAEAIVDRLQAEEAGRYAKGPVRDEETMGYFAYDAVGLPLNPPPAPASKKSRKTAA